MNKINTLGSKRQNLAGKKLVALLKSLSEMLGVAKVTFRGKQQLFCKDLLTRLEFQAFFRKLKLARNGRMK